MRYAAAGVREIRASFNSYLPTQTGDVKVNPRNPENPDSKPIFAIIFKLKPVGEKTMRASRLYFRCEGHLYIESPTVLFADA